MQQLPYSAPTKKFQNNPLKAGKKTILDFASNTTIHGISYIFNTTLLILERLLWLVVFGTFAFLAMYWSTEAYNQWNESPVLTSVKTTGRIHLILYFYLLLFLRMYVHTAA